MPRWPVEVESVEVRLNVAFHVEGGKLMAAFSNSQGVDVATIDLTDKNNWNVMHGATAEGEFMCQADGTYVPGHPGSIERNVPPDPNEIEDMNVYLGAKCITSLLNDDDTESAHDALIEAAHENDQ